MKQKIHSVMPALLIFFMAFTIAMCSVNTEAQVAVPQEQSVPANLSQDPPVTEHVVAVPEPAAPPEWAIDLMMTAQDIPYIGPIVSKVLLYLGVISSIVTALLAFLLTTLNALSKVLNLAGLVSLANQLQVIKNSKIMYYLKMISLFNAKKEPAKKEEK